MKNWTIADGQDRRVYLINDGRDAVGEIVFCETRRPDSSRDHRPPRPVRPGRFFIRAGRVYGIPNLRRDGEDQDL